MSENQLIIKDDFLKYVLYSQDLFGGKQIVLRFPNNYGISIVRHEISHFRIEVGIALFYGDLSNQWYLDYPTEITNDVMYPNDFNDLIEIMSKVKELPYKEYPE